MATEQLTVVDLVYDAPVTSSGTGTIADYINDYPQAAADWASLAAVFAESRVLAMEVRFVPNVTGATQGSLAYAPFFVVLDLTSSLTTLTSYTNASNYALSQEHSLNMPWRMFHRMAGVEESTFVPTSSAATDYSFKTFATGLTASTTYGRYFIHWKCQFRGRL